MSASPRKMQPEAAAAKFREALQMAAKFMRELADIFDEGIASQEIVPQDSISSQLQSPSKLSNGAKHKTKELQKLQAKFNSFVSDLVNQQSQPPALEVDDKKEPKQMKSAKKSKKEEKIAIKKPLSPFMLYCIERRPQFKIEKPDLPLVEVSRMIGTEWKTLSEDQKKKWVEKSKDDRLQYSLNMVNANQAPVQKTTLLKKPSTSKNQSAAANDKQLTDLLKKQQSNYSQMLPTQTVDEVSEAEEESESSMSSVEGSETEPKAQAFGNGNTIPQNLPQSHSILGKRIVDVQDNDGSSISDQLSDNSEDQN